MSNACVINATHNSGQTAGSPVTIEAGGTIVFKAFGSGSGAWSATLAFAPSATESPVTLTISNGPGKDSARTSVVSTGATSWVGWVQSFTGEFEVSGIVCGDQPDEALAGDLGVFVAGKAPTKAVKAGATYRDTVGTSYTYSAGAGWVDSSFERLDPYDIAWGHGSSVIMWGSSSSAYCTTVADTDLPSHRASLTETSDGYFNAANYKFSLGLFLKQNRAVAGSTTSAILAKLTTDINSVGSFDIAVLQLMANDLPGTLDYASAAAAINISINAGKRIILVAPHAKYASTAADLQKYREYRDWCFLWESRAPKSIIVADHFKATGEMPVTVETGFTNDGIHLNAVGSWLVADAWERIRAWVSIDLYAPEQLGVIVSEIDFSLATFTNVSLTMQDGLPKLTATAAGSSPIAKVPVSDMPIDRPLRLFADFDIVSCGSGVGVAYVPGTRISSGTDIARHMTINYTNGGSYNGVTGPRKYLSIPHTLSQSSITVDMFLGSGIGSTVVVRRVCLLAAY